ncbi:hypothetical protein BDC45DRAFT_29545 [Circinella umbellata]|nr:hypothetical protein BDC45DRAFT_29545 [Circinella umbellata]
MSALTLAFAENKYHHDDNNNNDDDNATIGQATHYLSDNDVFPPLNATNANAYELVKDGVVFSEGSTVWVNHRSYAEAAETGGVVHEPIAVFTNSTPTALSSTVPLPLQPTLHTTTKYNDDNEEDYIDDVYYQVKGISPRKANGDSVAYARQLKQIELTHHRELRKALENLPDVDQVLEKQETKQESIQEMEELVDGLKKILAYLLPPHYNGENLRPDWYYNGTRQECHRRLRRRTLQVYKDDNFAGVERAWDKIEEWFGLADKYNGRDPYKIHREVWRGYHETMKYLIQYTLIPKYEDYIGRLDYHQNKTRKQQLWMIRSTIPSKQYINSKTNRTNYALSILREYNL